MNREKPEERERIQEPAGHGTPQRSPDHRKSQEKAK